jgi:hypothetical protein
MPFDPDADIQSDLSQPVREAVGSAVDLVETIVAEFLEDDRRDILSLVCSAMEPMSQLPLVQMKE